MKVALLQINNSFAGQNYLPYSVAVLEAYFRMHGNSSNMYEFLPYIYKRAGVQEIVNKISEAKVVGLSLYAWNTRLSLAVARQFRLLRPDALIFAGGPSVPDDSSEFLRENPYLDIVLHNEGEVPFTQLLDSFIFSKEFHGVESATYIHEGKVKRNSNAARIADLSIVPSPFLSGTFDKIIHENPDESWIGLWETNRGCPFTCTYCDWGSATGSKKIGMFDMERLDEEINWFSSNKMEFIFCCDANFGMFPRDPNIARMVGNYKRSTGYPHALSVQNTKNSTERSYETQKILCEYGLNKGVTLSMQTLSDAALSNIKRSNIRLSSFFELQKRFIDESIPTYSDLILGLPGETFKSYTEGLCQLIESGQHNRIQFNNLSILPNAEMAKPEYRELHGIKTVTTNIVNMHGSIIGEKDIAEEQELVVETKTLPLEDWKRVRAYSWLVSFLYFDKVAQVPLALANGALGIPFRVIMHKMTTSGSKYPVLHSIYEQLLGLANSIAGGGEEYIFVEEWLGIYWPVDEFMFIQYVIKDSLSGLYEELSEFLSDVLLASDIETFQHYGRTSVSEFFNEACKFNFWLINGPSRSNELFKCNWSIPDAYTARLNGNFANLERRNEPSVYRAVNNKKYDNFSDWLQYVVWYGNKRGAYLVDYEEVKS